MNRRARRAEESRARRPEIRDLIRVVIRLYEDGLQNENVLKIRFVEDLMTLSEEEKFAEHLEASGRSLFEKETFIRKQKP